MQISRGDVFTISFGSRKGHEQEGFRPAIVVQADLYCALSTLWVIPTSTRAYPDIDFHVPVTIGGSDDRLTEILGGLEEGAEYVAAGAFELKAKIVTSALGGHAGHGH